jgi:serine/threonine-protein kinase RsbW
VLDNRATVKLATGPLLGPVLTRVVGMLAARADWPVDRVDDALLVADAISAHGAAHALDGHLTVALHASEDELELDVGSLSPDGARGLHADAELPGVGNVLDRIATEVSFEPDKPGPGERLVIRIARAA